MPKHKKFALIWWLETKEKDVINASIIAKKSRHVNEIVKLTWKDYKSQKTTKAEAKILAINGKLHFYVCVKNNYFFISIK